MNLTIDKDRVLKAASQCGDAKCILQTLFPEAFEKELFQSKDGNVTIGNNRMALDEWYRAGGVPVCGIVDGVLHLAHFPSAFEKLGIKCDNEGCIVTVRA